MRIRPPTLLPLLCLLQLGACATEETRDRPPEIGDEAISQQIGCTEDQVAICIDVDCGPDDWACADRSSLRDMFSPHRNN